MSESGDDETRADMPAKPLAESRVRLSSGAPGLERMLAVGDCVQQRYSVLAAIGRGGMAAIYRVLDLTTQRELALKQLAIGAGHKHYAASAAMFEREFHTLAELSHPRVIAVYDYGIDERGPFYTMELLDGGDLRARSPLPWREACSLIYDVCSSLALIHSRRLVHRDVSPGNVRCTRDGQAKLIDFGAMVPMGPGGFAVGTPHFVAPEVVHRSNLDARTDLFSLGATLYYALTGRSPYPAKDFSAVIAAWSFKPAPPSKFVPGIPDAIDALVLALCAVEPAMRPRTAFEVMQRLAAAAGIERAEPVAVSRAYLATPVMVGRERELLAIRGEMNQAFEGRGRSALLEGTSGVGRSRMLDACALAAKTLGAVVLRASGTTGAGGSFGAATMLAEQIIASAAEAAWATAHQEGVFDTLFELDLEAQAAGDAIAGARPRLKAFAAEAAKRYEIQTALGAFLLGFARKRAVVLAVDDVHRIDEPSAALLAALASRADRRHLLILATTETDAEPVDRHAFDVLAKHSTSFELEAITRAHTEQLLESVFGDVPNVAIVGAGIHAIAAGNPRATLDLAQHLVDRGLVRYELGSWTLPARLEANDLPSSAEEAMRARIATLGPLALWFAEAQSLATYQAFTRENYAKLRPDAGGNSIDRALNELVSQQIVMSDGRVYNFAHRGWCTALELGLSTEGRAERHRALADLYEGRPGLGVVRHALLAGLENRALDALAPLLAVLPEASKIYETTDLSPSEVAATFERALSAAERSGRNERELAELRRWLASLSVVSDDVYYQRSAPGWLVRLKHDSGYTLWQQHAELEPQARLSRTMQLAFERYEKTPASERVYRPDEAIKALTHYVGISLAIGTSRVDSPLVESLPALLEPFAPLGLLVQVIWQNAIAARESSCRAQPERARARWREVYQQLVKIEGGEQHFIGVFRRAVAHAIGANEAMLGIASASEWADVLDEDPVQRVNGLYLRRIVRMQQGDWDGAERFRRRAEITSLQARARQMFNTLTWVELLACAMARDLTGLKQVSERIAGMAARSPGWLPFVCVAEGNFHLLCDSFAAALAAFERGRELIRPTLERSETTPNSFCALNAGYIEALNGLERHAEAKTAGAAVLELCKEREIGVAAHGISRALALAEARLGEHANAAARLDAVMASQLALDISGLHLGASFEARARVAIWAGDDAAINRYAALTAREYRHGRNSPLGARYERLMQEARRVAKTDLPALADFDPSIASGLTQITRITEARPAASEVVSTAETTDLE